jgi:hypothetical protein
MDDQRTSRAIGLKWPRRIRIAFAILFGIICVLSVVFWVRSYYWYQAVFVRQGTIVYAVGAYGGYVCASIRPAYAKGKAWKVNDWPMDKNREVVAREAKATNIFGFGGEKYHEGVAVLLVPAWFVSFGSGGASLLLWRAKAVAFTVRNLLIATALVAAILGLVVYPK